MTGVIIGCVVILFVIVIVYFTLQKRIQAGGKTYQIEKRLSATKSSGFSIDVFYHKVYLFFSKVPYISRYLFKIRRRLEIITNNDEFVVRKQTAKIILFSTLLTILLLIALVYINKSDIYMAALAVLGVIILHETIIDIMVNKLEDKLLKQGLEFFSQVRHFYHEYGMVEESVYDASLMVSNEIAVQATAIYEMLIANDSEDQLEIYYDTAPNRFLKSFAGLSYLTKEFGDRKVDGASLYLKNVNNITEELQLEILKRDKIDYIFQSLSFIAIAPLFVINALKDWAVSTFAITSMFYDGKAGRIMELVILASGFLCYYLLRRVKENSDRVKVSNVKSDSWQQKLYHLPFVEWLIDRLMPVPGTYQYKKNNQLLVDTNSGNKLEAVYVNKVICFILGFGAVLFLLGYLHTYAINQVYDMPTSENISFAELEGQELVEAQELTRFDNYYINKFKNTNYKKMDITVAILKHLDGTDIRIKTTAEAELAADRIIEKIGEINAEFLKSWELILSFAVAFVAYFIPDLVLIFQKKMRQLEIENEIMQFQTIILMLMRIERISVQDIVEWLERFANIFKPGLSTCLNNFEAGGWKALEQLKEETSSDEFIKLIKNMQSAVDKIPVVNAFDELESERAFFQDKRKEANERLINKKAMIGKIIGFAPLILLFVGYLIVPLIVVSMSFMGEYLSQMSTYT